MGELRFSSISERTAPPQVSHSGLDGPAKNGTACQNATRTCRIRFRQVLRGNAPVNLNHSPTADTVQKRAKARNLLIAALQIRLAAPARAYRHQQDPIQPVQIRFRRPVRGFRVQDQSSLHTCFPDGPQGFFRAAGDFVMDGDPFHLFFGQFRYKRQRIFHHQVHI